MKSPASFSPAGVVLAGGRSSRFGLPSKALAALAGEPMIRHVLRRLAAQADPIMISVQDVDPALQALGHELVKDLVESHRGPLTGLGSAMQNLTQTQDGDWLLLCPCDAPFLPADLAMRLHEAALGSGKPVSVARYENELQPAFSLWNRAVFGAVHASVMEQGRGGLKQMLRELPHAVVDWPVRKVPPFFNVNTPQDLARAGRLLDLQAGEA